MMKISVFKILGLIAVLIILLKIPISYFNPNNAIEERIKRDIHVFGIKKVLYRYFIDAPFKEEMRYRIVWAIPFLFVFRKSSILRNTFYWLLVAGPSLFWALDHPYPLVYKVMIFIGGLFSDWIILYFSRSNYWQDYAKGIVIPFLAHAEVNIIIVSWVIFQNCI